MTNSKTILKAALILLLSTVVKAPTAFGQVAPLPTPPPPPVTNCKIELGAASVAGQVSDAFKCVESADSLIRRNPSLKITRLTFEKVQLYPGTGVLQLCKVGLGGTASAAANRIDGIACLEYADKVQTNNPNLKIAYVTFGSSFLHGAPAAAPQPQTGLCLITLSRGGSLSSQQTSEASCLAYAATIKANNPNNPPSSVSFNGKRIQ